MDFRERLAAMQKMYDASKNEAELMSGQVRMTEGDYVAVLSSLKLKESQTKKLMIQREYIISEGQYAGLPIRDIVMLNSEQNLVFFRLWANQLGFTCPGAIKELPEMLEAMIKTAPKVVLRLYYSGDYLNTDVKEVVGYTGVQAKKSEEPKASVKQTPPTPSPAPKAQTKPVAKKEEPKSEPAVEVKEEVQNEIEVEDELSSLNRTQLKEFILANELDIRVTVKWTDDDIRVAIRKALSVQTSEEQKPEVKSEPKTPPKASPKAAAKPKKDETVDVAKKLKDFMRSQQIELTDDNFSLDDLKEIINAYEFPGNEMTEEEKKFLQSLELGHLIIA